MEEVRHWPDLTRTETAVGGFDRGETTGEDVGRAFALDTADRNAEDTARSVRPGKAYPPGGEDDLSWLRQLLRSWRAEKL